MGSGTNTEGLTLVEWLRAAGAINCYGIRVDQYDEVTRELDALGRRTFSALLRKEWRNGVDPTEWRNYFDDEWATLESWREFKRQLVRSAHAAARLTGEPQSIESSPFKKVLVDPRFTPPGMPQEDLSGKFNVHVTFRVSSKQKRTVRWWED